MSFDGSSPLDRISQPLRKKLERKRSKLEDLYIQLGPDGLKKYFSLKNEDNWHAVFDFLVFETDAMKKCARIYGDFFVDLVSKKGPQAARKVLKIEEPKYDMVFEEIFDFIAVSHGALFNYVNNNLQDFSAQVKQGRAGGLQRSLNLQSKKYQSLWFEVLETLMNTVCTKYYDERQYDNGLQSFTLLMNSLRTHRSLRSNSKMWEFATA